MRKYFFLLLTTIPLAANAAHETCSDCHVDTDPQSTSATLRVSAPQLCLQCHPDRVAPGEHVINVVPKNPVPASLPLVNGEVSCTTCHDAHLNTAGKTRMEAAQLCAVCHAK